MKRLLIIILGLTLALAVLTGCPSPQPPAPTPTPTPAPTPPPIPVETFNATETYDTAIALMADKDWDGATELLESVIRKAPDSGEAKLATGKIEEIKKLKATASAPTTAQKVASYVKKGVAQREANQYDTAESYFKKALALDPKSKSAHKEYAFLHFKHMEKNVASGKGRGDQKVVMGLEELKYYTDPGSDEWMKIARKYFRMTPSTVVASYIWACTNRHHKFGWRLWVDTSRKKHFGSEAALALNMDQNGSLFKSSSAGKLKPRIETVGNRKRVHLSGLKNTYIDVYKGTTGWFISGGSTHIVKIAQKGVDNKRKQPKKRPRKKKRKHNR
ncbi:tetratricopeptide repeat protein [Candidatus Dependentiae bacterium]|nr:tetratricopeptide repeat protein [Candidatus Dependentiae bacterium]